MKFALSEIVLLLLLTITFANSLHIQKLQDHSLFQANKKDFHLTINKNHNGYTGLSVDDTIPKTFIQGQYYTITGKISFIASKSTHVTLILTQKTTDAEYQFHSPVAQNQNKFSLIFKLPPPGKYYLFLFSGSSGNSDGSLYEIKSFSTQTSNTNSKSGSNFKPTNIALNIVDNKLFVNWNSTNCPIAKITFSQSLNKTFYASNCKNNFQVPFAQFSNFKPQNTQVFIACADSSTKSLSGRNSQYSSSTQLNFKAGYHNFAQQIDNTEISIKNIPWKINLNENILISGQVLTDCRNKIYVEIPSNGFQHYYIDSKQDKEYKVPANTKISVNLNGFNESGAYILQINDFNGQAVVNRPIYVGQSYPLIPDFIDIQPSFDEAKILAQTPKTIQAKRDLLLKLINQKRKEWKLPPLYLDQKLNPLAQNYAEDMMNRKFFGHYNPQGLGPQDRANAMGIYDSIGQNVAYNDNLTSGHYSLCRSAGHLQNIVDKDWTRVGLGIAFSSSQQVFYIAQEFSTRDMQKFPLTSSQKSAIDKQLSSAVTSGCPKLVYSSFLTDTLRKQVSKPKDQQFSKDFGNSIISQGRSYSYFWISGSYNSDFVKNNITPQYISKKCQNYKKFGAVQTMDGGQIKVTIIFVG